MKFTKRILLVFYVTGAVGLNLLVAIAMKLLSQTRDISLVMLLMGIVVLFNGLRMLVWMYANNHFPLSTIYPLTSIFYPLVLGVSYFFNEEITHFHILGTVLIATGVFWLGWRVKYETNE